jgi:hypothetical protein
LALLAGLPPEASAQKWAPIIGGWRVQLDLGGVRHVFSFETDSEGVYGRGTGRFRFDLPDGGSILFPATWSNTDPQRVSVAGDVVLGPGGTNQAGTLVLRLTLAPGKGFVGDALFVGADLGTRRGTFTMERTLSPEELLAPRVRPGS